METFSVWPSSVFISTVANSARHPMSKADRPAYFHSGPVFIFLVQGHVFHSQEYLQTTLLMTVVVPLFAIMKAPRF